MNKNPYSLLGVSPTATQDEIRNAYRKLAKKLHPDLNPGNTEAASKFKEINAAYELVGTAEERAKYDRGELDEQAQRANEASRGERAGPYYHQTQQGGGRYSQGFGAEGGAFFDEDFLSSVFGAQAGAAGGGRAKARPRDELYEMEIGFKDSVLGAEREIGLPSGKKLRVKIPAGVASGAKLRFAGQAASPGADVYVQLTVKPSALFRREANDLELEVPISFAEAVLGSEIKVPTIDGSVLLKVPSGVSTGTKLKVAGKGVPHGGSRGDQIVTLKVVVPKSVDDPALKAALQEWSGKQSFDPRAGLMEAEAKR
jgi:DnaJ-class molecular chaperone